MFGFRKKVNDGKLLSVIIPSYNHEKYIREAIESVLQQTYTNLELIIVDDGSKDNSLEIIRSYDDARIKLIAQENAGAHNAINRGLSEAKGEYLAILNSDDVYEKKRFQVMIEEMEKNPEVQFLCSYIEVIDAEGKKLGVKEGWRNMPSWVAPNKELSLQAEDQFVPNLLVNNFTSTTSNFLFTKRLYEKIGGMRNLRFAHDWDFALRAAAVTKCAIIEKPLMRYRVHGTNTISTNRKWMLFEIAWIWAANIERFNEYLFGDGNDQKNMVRVLESLNLQGNDKIFWAILLFINEHKLRGTANPEEILLNDNHLRNRLLEYVNE